MKSKMLVAFVFLVLATVAYAFRALTPATVAAPSAAAAQAAYQRVQEKMLVPIYRSQDNILAMELVVYETENEYWVAFQNFDVPASSAAYVQTKVLPDCGMVEVSQFGIATQYKMVAVDGAVVTPLPKTFFGVWSRIKIGAWLNGTDWTDPHASIFWMDVNLHVQ